MPPIQRKPVRNIRAAIPLTSKDDYPFYNVTINWDPPAYHYSKVLTYYVTLSIYKRCDEEIVHHYVDSHIVVSWLQYQCRFWCSFPFQKLDSASLLQFLVIMIRLDMCRPCPPASPLVRFVMPSTFSLL